LSNAFGREVVDIRERAPLKAFDVAMLLPIAGIKEQELLT
jgi:hypothetical protein